MQVSSDGSTLQKMTWGCWVSPFCRAKFLGDIYHQYTTFMLAYIPYMDPMGNQYINYLGLSENVVYPEKPNGFADHYPYEKWLFHWGYTPFSDIPIFSIDLAHGDLAVLQFRQPKLGCFDQVSTENEAWMGMKELHERILSGDLT